MYLCIYTQNKRGIFELCKFYVFSMFIMWLEINKDRITLPLQGIKT